MNNQKYIVYVHTLRRDGRRYVGITRRTPKQRWHNGKNYSNNPYFYNAIKKYGWDAFEHEIIYTGLSKDEACEIEKRLIKQYKTQQHDYGFNVGNGGEGAESVSESTRRKMRRARLGVSPWNKGVKMSKEQRAALSKSRKENPSRYWLGKHRSNETKRKISERNMANYPNKVSYECIPQSLSLNMEVSFVENEKINCSDDETATIGIPGIAGPGSFWNILDGKTGYTEVEFDKNENKIKRINSISPSSVSDVAYLSYLMREGYDLDDYADFLEIHPSSDSNYKIIKNMWL